MLCKSLDMAASLMVNLDEVYQFAIELGKEAGSMLLAAANDRIGNGLRTGHLEKESAVDLVTQADEGMCKLQRWYTPSPITPYMRRP